MCRWMEQIVQKKDGRQARYPKMTVLSMQNFLFHFLSERSQEKLNLPQMRVLSFLLLSSLFAQ